jgi:tRNA threonylcarbamoyladenosine biosynthesis protein TsaE
MSSASTFVISSSSPSDTLKIAGILGRKLRGGELVDIVGDLGSGKTEFIRGLTKGIGSADEVSSPSFTIKNIYHGKSGLELHHFDFYRLTDPGLMKNDILEVLTNPKAIVVVEWGDIVKDFLPNERLEITIQATGDDTREFIFKAASRKYKKILEALK